MSLPPEILRHEMQVRATLRVLEANRWLTAKQVVELGHRRPSNADRLLERWKRHQQIFSIRLRGEDCYPDYVLDPQTRYRPRPELQPVLQVFHGVVEGWRLAFWFDSPNSYLDGLRPRECFWLVPEQALNAARMEISGPQHG